MQYAHIPLKTYITITVTSQHAFKALFTDFGLRADEYSNFLHTSACITHAKERTIKRKEKSDERVKLCKLHSSSI